MKNKLKMISVTLALVLTLCVCFVACNKTKTDPAKERADAVASVENMARMPHSRGCGVGWRLQL